MGQVIDMNKYKKHTREMVTMFSKLINRLEQNHIKKHEYSLAEIDIIAKEILSKISYYSEDSATPIVKIAKEFGFITYRETLDDDLSGDIYINGKTKDEYDNDRIILVNKNDELFHQRFVVAHELAHYLFDFLGNDEYKDTSIKFSDTYYKNMHETVSEQRANRFAAAILMPEDAFIKQYNLAKSIDKNRMFVITYLSRFFETTMSSIERRIAEVLL